MQYSSLEGYDNNNRNINHVSKHEHTWRTHISFGLPFIYLMSTPILARGVSDINTGTYFYLSFHNIPLCLRFMAVLDIEEYTCCFPGM